MLPMELCRRSIAREQRRRSLIELPLVKRLTDLLDALDPNLFVPAFHRAGVVMAVAVIVVARRGQADKKHNDAKGKQTQDNDCYAGRDSITYLAYKARRALARALVCLATVHRSAAV
jgi:hypothetical protein